MKTTSHKQNAYFKNQVLTADKKQLVLMMYDGAIRFLIKAKIEVKRNNKREQGIFLSKANNIIIELSNSLDFGKDPIATDLHWFYSTISNYILDANINNDPAKIEDAIKMLEELYEGWSELFAKDMAGGN